jgi:hypothetical protein
VLQLLRPWYVLLHDGHLRSQFEPKAQERRALKHVVRISKQCVGLRARAKRTDWVTRVIVQYRTFIVHFGHMFLGLGNLSWQAEYNAACFDALLLVRPVPTAPRFGWLASLGRRWRDHQRRVRRERALRNLGHAIRGAGSELSPVWVAKADPDLAFFRSPPDDEFNEIVGKMPQAPIEQVTKLAADVPIRPDLKAIAPPAPPWANPQRRLALWLAVGLAYVAFLVYALFGMNLGALWLLLLPPLVIPGWRVRTALRETLIDLEASERRQLRKEMAAEDDEPTEPPAEAA